MGWTGALSALSLARLFGKMDLLLRYQAGASLGGPQAEAIRLVLKGEKLVAGRRQPRLHPLAAARACGGGAHRYAPARLRKTDRWQGFA
jgi:hypothetical protein